MPLISSNLLPPPSLFYDSPLCIPHVLSPVHQNMYSFIVTIIADSHIIYSLSKNQYFYCCLLTFLMTLSLMRCCLEFCRGKWCIFSLSESDMSQRFTRVSLPWLYCFREGVNSICSLSPASEQVTAVSACLCVFSIHPLTLHLCVWRV